MLTHVALFEGLRQAINDRLVDGRYREAKRVKVRTGSLCVTQVAHQLGLSHGYFSRIRTGSATPVALMLRIAQELGTDVRLIIDGKEVQ